MAACVHLKLKARGEHFAVPALEGLWWGEHERDTPREQWNWQLIVRMPIIATSALTDQVRATVMAKKKAPEIGRVLFESMMEGVVVQLLHVCPFATEPQTIERLHSFIYESGYRPRGVHHEVYLPDFRRTAPEKFEDDLSPTGGEGVANRIPRTPWRWFRDQDVSQGEV